MKYLIYLYFLIFNLNADGGVDVNTLRITLEEKRSDLSILREVHNQDRRISCSFTSSVPRVRKDPDRCRSLHRTGEGHKLFIARERGLLHEIERLNFIYEELAKESGQDTVPNSIPEVNSVCDEVTAAYVVCNGMRYIPDTSQVDSLNRDASKIIPQLINKRESDTSSLDQ